MSKTQLYLGVNLLDFTGVVNVKRQVTDYRDLSIGSSVKSYTLDVPLTPTNRLYLKWINDLRSREYVTDTARLLVDQSELIKGKMRVLDFTSLYAKIIIEADDWVDGISGTSIKDLSWAGGDEHTFSSTNVTVSWTAAAGAFYRYPLINFAELVSGDYGGSGSAVYPYDFYPTWNIEDIVTKVIADSGYTLASSGFFAGTFGRSLYMLSAPAISEDDFITGKDTEANVVLDSDNFDNQTGVGALDPVSLHVDQVMVMTNETIDEGNDFSISTYRYTAPETGTYRFQSIISIHCDLNPVGINYTSLTNSLSFQVRKNGTPVTTLSASGDTTFDTGNSFTVDSGYIHLEASDYIDIYVDALATATRANLPGTVDPELYVIAGVDVSYFQTLWSEHNLWSGIGKTISPSEYLPDLDGVDFLQGLKQAFNLRFFADKNNKTLYIETSDDFHGSTIIDWSDKVDYSEEPVMEVISSNYKKTQRFLWNPAPSDKAYSNYVSANGIPFQKELVLDSEYVKPGVTERPNSVFSPTVLGDMPQIGHWSTQKVPRLFGSGEFVSASRSYPAYRAKSWQPRIFEWKGMVALTIGNFDYYDDPSDASATNYTTFPSVETPDMNDMFSDFFLKDWSRIEKNKMAAPILKLTPAEIQKFSTVVGTPANEGFRATYKTNIEGVDMLYICPKITTDGDRVKAELVQKL